MIGRGTENCVLVLVAAHGRDIQFGGCGRGKGSRQTSSSNKRIGCHIRHAKAISVRPEARSAPAVTQRLGRFDVRSEVAVGRSSTRPRCGCCVHLLERRRGARRTVEIDALGRGEQLDADDGRGVLAHVAQPPRGVRGHGDVVFLVGPGRHGVDAADGAAIALFSATRAAAVTCAIMKPEFSAAVLRPGRPAVRSSSGSTSIAVRRSEMLPISATASASVSAANATGSAWKLPPDSTSPCSTNSSGLSVTALASMPQRALAVADDDRGTRPSPAAGSGTSRGPAPGVAVDDARRGLRCPRAAAEHARHGDLARLAAQLRGCAHRTARRCPCSASTDIAPATTAAAKHVLGAEQARQRERGGHLRAVDAAPDPPWAAASRGCKPGDASALRPPAILCRARAPGRCRAAPRPDAPAARDRPRRRPSPCAGMHGIDLVLEQRAAGRRSVSCRNAGMPARQRVDLERQYRAAPPDRTAQRRRRGVRQHQIALQRFELIVRDARLREQAEAGVDAVGRCAGRHDPLDETARGRDAARDPPHRAGWRAGRS